MFERKKGIMARVYERALEEENTRSSNNYVVYGILAVIVISLMGYLVFK